jgi:hypothetical protein
VLEEAEAIFCSLVKTEGPYWEEAEGTSYLERRRIYPTQKGKGYILITLKRQRLFPTLSETTEGISYSERQEVFPAHSEKTGGISYSER